MFHERNEFRRYDENDCVFEVCLALMQHDGIDDDSNNALATMAFPAKLVNAIRSSTEILVEERSRAYLRKSWRLAMNCNQASSAAAGVVSYSDYSSCHR